VPVTVGLGDLDQPLDLGLGQVFAGAECSVRLAPRCNCLIFGGWRDELEVRFPCGLSPASKSTV
jgi:hypothetical protein